MKVIRQNGVAVMTLSDLIDDFCLAQGNMREALYAAQARHARWSWKDLFRTTMWQIRKAVIDVDCQKHSFHLPGDCERVINISVVDQFGKLHPLGFNPDWNTAHIKCVAKCSCNTCGGNNTLCAAVDSISAVFNTVIIKGSPYTETTLTRYNGNGAVQTQQTIPTWDELTGAVIYNTVIKTSCNVEVTDKGCIKVTQPNMDILRENFGCGNFIDGWIASGYGGYNAYRELIPSPTNYWGEWNRNAEDPTIIELFRGARRHFNHNENEELNWRNSIRQVVVEYQTNGETPDTEITVPEYAVEAVQIGMAYRQKYLNPKVGEADKMAAKNAFRAAKMEVAKYLNPAIMANIVELQTLRRPW